jgi:chemotaxis protein histidine kinase CheA
VSSPTINGTHRPTVPSWDGWQPIHIGGIPAANPEPTSTPAPQFEEPTVAPEPAFDPIALAEADRIRKLAEAEAEAARIAAEAEADAVRTTAEAEAEKLRLANERAAMRLEKERVDHVAYVAKKAAETAKAKAEEDKAGRAEQEEAEEKTARIVEQQRSESWWKWGARGIYFVGLVIAAPIQFLAFWDPARPFLVAAPALLEGLALVLAAGAAWAVAHRRDVRPYRIGIMFGACIAAGINMWHGLTESSIGLNAGLIGALASLGGPIVLMAYEHGMAQKADGIPSRRETRQAAKEKAAEKAARDKARAEREAAAKREADAKAAREKAAEAEQQRKDKDRETGHPEVWELAESLRQARGSATVTEQIWGEAWLTVTGYSKIGMTFEVDARSKAAQDRAKNASNGSFEHVESQMPHRPRRDPDAPDGRRNNGGTPPIRRAGDTAPQHPAARAAAAETARRATVSQHVTDTPREDS